jgi:acyl carrier protein
LSTTDAQQVRTRMAQLLKQPVDRLADATVLTDLVAESFVLVDMVIELQDDLGIRLMHDDLKAVKTVGDLLAVIASKTGRLG